MQSETYECVDYKCRLYKTNDDILLLDIFINNKEKYIIKIMYYDNILNYIKYKKKYKYYYVSEKLGYDSEQYQEKVDSTKINFNKIFPILEDYYVYSADIKNGFNLISATLAKKGLLKEFTPQIDESKINIKWMPLWMK